MCKYSAKMGHYHWGSDDFWKYPKGRKECYWSCLEELFSSLQRECQFYNITILKDDKEIGCVDEDRIYRKGVFLKDIQAVE